MRCTQLQNMFALDTACSSCCSMNWLMASWSLPRRCARWMPMATDKRNCSSPPVPLTTTSSTPASWKRRCTSSMRSTSAAPAFGLSVSITTATISMPLSEETISWISRKAHCWVSNSVRTTIPFEFSGISSNVSSNGRSSSGVPFWGESTTCHRIPSKMRRTTSAELSREIEGQGRGALRCRGFGFSPLLGGGIGKLLRAPIGSCRSPALLLGLSSSGSSSLCAESCDTISACRGPSLTLWSMQDNIGRQSAVLIAAYASNAWKRPLV
mmetsp:Transcript_41818/g.120818  ORF Transcript_41818/g.120818 Transcript_41818/m.120818 type:complete len:268 (-) Transcript_41818:76-879(-)